MADNPIASVNLAFWQRPRVQPRRPVVRRADRLSIALTFAYLFAFLGVMGVLVGVPGLKSLRGYYLVLPIGLLTLTILGNRTTWKHLLTCIPMVGYLVFSAATAKNDVVTQSYTPMGVLYSTHSHALPSVMLAFQSLFVIVTASHIRIAAATAKVRFVEMFMSGYLISLSVGYVFMIGRKVGLLSFDFISRFCFMRSRTDTRFSPGSDPNEYGIMTSLFLSIYVAYLLYGVGRCQPRTWVKILFAHPLTASVLLPLTSLALLFTNTRSAIVAFVAAICWILACEVGPRLRRPKIAGNALPRILFSGLAALVIVPIAVINFDHLKFLVEKFSRAVDDEASTEGRYTLWREALEHFELRPLLGSGYHTHEYIHNTYLQMICDLGVLGAAALVVTTAVVFAQFYGRISFFGRVASNLPEDRFLVRIKQIALMHVLWFAMTNHNFDQFLTWFVVLLVLALGRQAQPKRALSVAASHGSKSSELVPVVGVC